MGGHYAISVGKGGDEIMNADVLRYKTMLSWARLYADKGSIKEQIKRKGIGGIIVYGATEIAEVLIRQCISEDITVYGVCDKRVIKQGMDYYGVPIIPVSDIKNYDATLIITSMGFVDEIKRELDGICEAISLRELLEGNENNR